MSDAPGDVGRVVRAYDEFLGETIQIALVTEDLYGSLDSLIALGMGPWKILELGPENATMHYRGEDTGFRMKVGIATQGTMAWEVIEPTGGKSIYQDFLDEGRSGLHHVAVSCGDIPYAERREQFERRGYEEVQGGTAFGYPFGYFQNAAVGSICVETYAFPDGYVFESDEWYPAPPEPTAQ